MNPEHSATLCKNLGLVRFHARRFARTPDKFDDLVQEGSIGLLRAVETFDPSEISVRDALRIDLADHWESR